MCAVVPIVSYPGPPIPILPVPGAVLLAVLLSMRHSRYLSRALLLQL